MDEFNRGNTMKQSDLGPPLTAASLDQILQTDYNELLQSLLIQQQKLSPSQSSPSHTNPTSKSSNTPSQNSVSTRDVFRNSHHTSPTVPSVLSHSTNHPLKSQNNIRLQHQQQQQQQEIKKAHSSPRPPAHLSPSQQISLNHSPRIPNQRRATVHTSSNSQRNSSLPPNRGSIPNTSHSINSPRMREMVTAKKIERETKDFDFQDPEGIAIQENDYHTSNPVKKSVENTSAKQLATGSTNIKVKKGSNSKVNSAVFIAQEGPPTKDEEKLRLRYLNAKLKKEYRATRLREKQALEIAFKFSNLIGYQHNFIRALKKGYTAREIEVIDLKNKLTHLNEEVKQFEEENQQYKDNVSEIMETLKTNLIDLILKLKEKSIMQHIIEKQKEEIENQKHQIRKLTNSLNETQWSNKSLMESSSRVTIDDQSLILEDVEKLMDQG